MNNQLLRLLSRSTLDLLIETKTECQTLDYKRDMSFKTTKDKFEFSKDIVSFANTNGGFIIIGIDDKTREICGIPTGDIPIFKDGKSINDKVDPVLKQHITIHCALHYVGTSDGRMDVPVALLFIPPVDVPIPMPFDGNYRDEDGRPQQVFRQGDFYVRRADTSVRAISPNDLRRHKVDFMEHFDHVLVSSTSAPGGDENDNEFVNPYNIARAATDGMFKGRDQELRNMARTVANGNHVTIYGLQRVGKTSFVQRAVKEMAQKRRGHESIVLATVNLQELGSDSVTQRDFIDMTITAICQAIEDEKSERQIREAFDNYVYNSIRRQGDRIGLFRGFQAALEAIVRRFPHHVILFLDEFSELCRAIEKNDLLAKKPSYRIAELVPDVMYIDSHFMRWFSNLMKSPSLDRKLTFVFAARPFVTYSDFERDLQVLKLTNPVWLYYLEESAAKALIREPIHGHLRVADDVAEYLYRLTAGHPYLIQYIMLHSVNAAQDRGESTIRLEDIKAIEHDLVHQGAPHQALFNLLDSDYGYDEIKNPEVRDLGKGTLALISKMGTERPEGWVEEREIKKMLARYGILERAASSILAKLKGAEIIKEMRADNTLFIRVAVPLLRKRYVEQNYFPQYFSQQSVQPVKTESRVNRR